MSGNRRETLEEYGDRATRELYAREAERAHIRQVNLLKGQIAIALKTEELWARLGDNPLGAIDAAVESTLTSAVQWQFDQGQITQGEAEAKFILIKAGIVSTL